jgi:deoxyribodipyrimidine photo-lyase
MQKLIDADVAIDHWQWQSHAGVSNRGRAWFRIYNPTKGIEKIDPKGIFIQHWVPELVDVPLEDLANLDYKMFDYHAPVVDHEKARIQALSVLEPIKHSYQRKSA